MTLATAAASLLLLTAGADLLPPSRPDPAREQRRAFVAGLPRGASFRSAGQSYQMAGNVRALPAAAKAPEQVLQAAGLSTAEVLERKGAFLLVREPGALSQAVQATPAGSDSHPVAINARTGGLGVVTGLITVRLRSVVSAVPLAADHGLTLHSTATGIRAAFYRVPPNQDIVAAAAALTKDRRVRSAEIEVQETVRELH